jgi:UDP-N-acetylmuramoyl-tripeptide--D-alanyl-D-alanine ligase
VLRIRPWQRHAIIEIGIAGRGQMIQYARMVRPDIVVVTAIGSEHNRSLGSLDNTRNEKAQILRGLHKGGLVVLNGDDPHVRAMAATTDAHVLTFGFNAGNDVRASDAHLDWPHGTCLTIQVGQQTREFRTKLLGRAMIYPILAAAAVASYEGFSLDRIVAAVEAVPPLPGRLQPVRLPSGAWLIRDDFKSTLETIDAALDVLTQIPGRRIVVLGEISEPVGSQGPHYRRLGARLAMVASRAVILGGCFQRYAAGAVPAGLPRAALVNAGRSLHDAVRAVQTDLGPGDVVLVKGRDTQRLDRVSLALQGRTVGCNIDFCDVRGTRCENCPMLELGQRAGGASP